MKLSLGPLLFHWKPERIKDFYFRIADEAPIDRVYLGEVVCSKRAPFTEAVYAEIVDRLDARGKEVVFSSLAEVMTRRERQMIESLAAGEYLTEANDVASIYHLDKRPFCVGPYVNVYNEHTLSFLARRGAIHVTLPAELPCESIERFAGEAKRLGVSLEVHGFGRVGLALSARCYHARAHGRVKDNCQFVCGEDPDGLTLKTLDGIEALVVNGIQTLSFKYVNLIHEIESLRNIGIDYVRLSPHDCDMVEISKVWQRALKSGLTTLEAEAEISREIPGARFANGFFYGKEGDRWLHEGHEIPTVTRH